jgi:hypothetical protein
MLVIKNKAYKMSSLLYFEKDIIDILYFKLQGFLSFFDCFYIFYIYVIFNTLN